MSKGSRNRNVLTYQGKLEPETTTMIEQEVVNEPVVNEPVVNETVNQEFEETVKAVFLGRAEDGKRAGHKATKWEKIVADYDFNIRNRDVNYTPGALQILRDLLNMEGQKTPIVCSQQKDGTLKILQGHRRHACMTLDRNDDLAKLNDPSGKGKMTPDLVRWQYILVEIRKELTAEDEVCEMLDHGGRKGLEPVEIFDAVMRLRSLGKQWTETRIITKLGLERGKATNHFRVAKLPKEVHEPYRQYLLGNKEAKIKLTAPVVNELYSAMEKDDKNKDFGIGGGKEFKKLWTEVQAKAGEIVPRSASVKTKLEAFRKDAQSTHKLLVDLTNSLLGDVEDVPNLDDIVGQITKALNAMYPPVEEEVSREV